MRRFKKALAVVFLLAIIYFPPVFILLQQGYGSSSFTIAGAVLVPVTGLCLLLTFIVEWFEA